MADKEVSDMTPGGAAAAGDLVHVVRSGNSRKITLGDAAGKSVGTTAGTVAAGDTVAGQGTSITALQASEIVLRRTAMNSLSNEAKAQAVYQRFLDMVGFGFKAAGDADGASASGTVDTAAGAWKPGTTGTTAGSGTTSGGTTYPAADFTVAVRDFAVANGVVVTSVGIHSPGAFSGSLKILNEDSTTQYDVLVDQAFSHAGGGWQDFTLSSPYTTPGSGTLRLAIHYPTTTPSGSSIAPTGLRSYKAGNVTGSNQSGFTADNSGIVPMRYTHSVTTNNATLITPYQTADAARTKVRGTFEIDPVVAATLGTDWTVEYTCNGGTNWTAASTYTDCGRGQGGRKIIETEEVTCTSGTSFAARVKNLNNKMVHVYKTSLKAAA